MGTGAASLACFPIDALGAQSQPHLFFKIALGEYSFNTLFRAGKYNPPDLAGLTRK
jgi:hypothetical protein